MASRNIWLSQNEIMALPTAGGAWDKVLAAANSSWGSANLADNNASHDVLTLAGALVAARTGNADMRAKTIAGLVSATKSGYSRTLELSRGLQTYIIAADIIDYREPSFMAWVDMAVNKDLSGHSGGTGIIGTAERSANNWGGHARASLAAAAAFTDRDDWKQTVITAHRAFIGAPAPGNKMSYTSTDWHAGTPQAGVNVKGAMHETVSLSGVLPEDWRRAAGYKWPPSVSGYMWEGMQGFIVCAVILHRMGWVLLTEGDSALKRSLDMLYGTGQAANNSPVFKNPASGDDTWIPWVANAYLATSYPTTAASAGKNMGYTDWTHAGDYAGTENPPPPPPPPVDPPPPNTMTDAQKLALIKTIAIEAKARIDEILVTIG